MNKNIVLSIVLSIVTCGIYGLYWMYTINDSAVRTDPVQWNTGFGMVLLLTLVTCGIYSYFWYYKMGKVFGSKLGNDNSVLYIILAVVGLGIVNYALIQNDINTIYPEGN